MRERILKNKLVLIGLAAILLVSCGGGSGGGGGSSHALINPGDNVSPAPKKPDIEGKTKPNTAGTNNHANNDGRTSLEELRKKMNENEVRKFILNEQKNSTESVPTDNRILNGDKVKVGVLDGDFINKKQDFENHYPGIDIMDRNIKPKFSDHGELVIKALRENNKIGIIAGSIGENDDFSGEKGTAVIPKLETYEKALEKFNPNQKVKIFSQSWGVPETIKSYSGKSEDEKMRALSSGQSVDEGKKIFNFYKEQVKKVTLFVWANGNTLVDGQNQVILFDDAYYQGGLPYLYPELEKGWITVVGVKKQDGNIFNKHYENSTHLAYPGDAKWWAISADAEVIDRNGAIHRGSSFAAPRVAKVAALVAEKYDWMTADQVRQTLFTTTDRTETIQKGERSTMMEPDSKYGWGMLNQERALKGPGAFINILRQYEHSPNSNNIFKANIPENKVSYFENDIYGNGGLEKLGKGTLHLTGNNSYERGSIVKEGTLEIHKVHAKEIKVENQGTLVLHSKAIVGYNKPLYSLYIDEIIAENITARNVDNKGVVKVKGTTAIIGGDYIVHSGSKTEMDFSSKVRILGKIDMQGGAITLSSNKYLATGEKATLMEASNIVGNFESTDINGMRKVNTVIKEGKLVAEVSRQNPSEYLGENVEASSKNVAGNVENVFQDLDKKVKEGTATKEELAMGATIQNMERSTFATASEMMSGEIYASAQALTFSQAQNINRDLSNRLVGLDNFKNSNKDSEVWFSAIGSGGKLRRDGYASADTRVTGGQFGIDTTFEGVTTLGVAMNYSYAKANFNRYAGESKSEMVGVSFYGKQDLPYGFYTAGRLGLSNISSKVERELLTSTGETVTGKIKHHDKMLSAYVEIGKKIGWFTPFIGYSQDYLRRGSFNESEASWGIKADKKNYRASNFLVGARAEYVGDKYRLQAYVTQAINTDKRDLSYEGSFTGSSVKQKFQGVKQAKNTTWIGFGAFREITPVFGVYGNVDFRVEDKKWADSVISTGLQYRF